MGETANMISKRVYLFLTGGLLLLSVGTGFAMQDRHSYSRAALRALETANLQLGKADTTHPKDSHQSRALELIRQAILEMEAELSAENSKSPPHRSG
jgi:surface antigen